MHLSCCGINHHSSSLVEREAFQIQRPELGKATTDFKLITGAAEAVVISTCNRIEFYRVDSEKTNARQRLEMFYSNRGVECGNRLDKLLFERQGTSAARHLFKVASGIDSALLGEYQILGQVKNAYSSACGVSGPGKILHKLFHHAFQVAKRIHSETEIGNGAQSLAGAAIELLRDRFDLNFSGVNAVIIGVNRSTEILLARLIKAGADVTVVNRTLFNAEKVTKSYKAATASLDDLIRILGDADVLFSVTSSRDYILTSGSFSSIKRQKPLYIVDLAGPRDIDPSIAEYPDVSLFDLDDLKQFVATAADERSIDLPYAMDLIEEQVTAFESWRHNLSSKESSGIRSIIEDDRQILFEKFKTNFRQGDYKALDAFSRNLYRQFLRRINSNPSVTEHAKPDRS